MSQETYFAKDRAEVAALLPAGARHVLEVGCGEGHLARMVGGAESYWGVEPAAAAARTAGQRLDRVLQGTWEEVSDQVPSQHFDLSICNDVIENMARPEDFLDSLLTNQRGFWR